jgi:hypothetical protein
MREYIKNWLKKSLTKITESDQEDIVVTGQLVLGKENIKETPTNK